MNGITPEEYARIVAEQKPHLIEIENVAEQIEYGTMEITLTVRAGVVVKMDFHNSKTWMRPK